MPNDCAQFLKRIRYLAGCMFHIELAAALDIKPTRIRAWLYKDQKPGAVTVRALKPTVDKLWIQYRLKNK